MKRSGYSLLLLASALLAPGSAGGHDSVEEWAQCKAIEDAAQRLECYDQLVPGITERGNEPWEEGVFVVTRSPFPEKAEGVFRVVTFGDQVTVGQGTAPKYSYPRQLEKLLQLKNPDGKFEVVNNGA